MGESGLQSQDSDDTIGMRINLLHDRLGRFACAPDRGGGIGGGKSEGSAQTVSVSAEGANVSFKGFSSPKRLTEHFEKHKHEFDFSSEEEYQMAADKFLQQPCSDDVIGYVTPKGKVVRFNTKTTEYATGFPGQDICTYMKAKCNKDGTANPERAMEYYIRRKQEGV